MRVQILKDSDRLKRGQARRSCQHHIHYHDDQRKKSVDCPDALVEIFRFRKIVGKICRIFLPATYKISLKQGDNI